MMSWSNNIPILDLHGLKHQEAREALDSFISDNIVFDRRKVSIITGRSENMKKIVNDLVDFYEVKQQSNFFNEGIIDIILKPLTD